MQGKGKGEESRKRGERTDGDEKEWEKRVGRGGKGKMVVSSWMGMGVQIRFVLAYI